MTTMTLRQFIRANRDGIDRAIVRALHSDKPDRKLTDNDRRLWVLNDESLYLWARREGVPL